MEIGKTNTMNQKKERKYYDPSSCIDRQSKRFFIKFRNKDSFFGDQIRSADDQIQ